MRNPNPLVALRAPEHTPDGSPGGGRAHPETTGEAGASRHVRSLVLAWRDEESGDEWTVDVRGSERFLQGLSPLGFVPLGERPTDGAGQRLPNVQSASASGTPASRERTDSKATSDSEHPAAPRMHESEVAEHRVRWTVRLARPWNPRKD